MALVNDSAQQWHHLDGFRFWGFDNSYISVTEWRRRREPEQRMGGRWIGNFGDMLTVVLLGSPGKQLLDVLPILVGADLTCEVLSAGSGGRRVGHLETESL